MSDLFAPPTDDELKSVSKSKEIPISKDVVFSPPSKEELDFASALDPGVAESFGGHAVNGALLGGRSKIAGAIASPSGALKAAQRYTGYLPFVGAPADNTDSDVKQYLKAKFADEAALSKSGKAHPGWANAGEFTGALVPATIAGPSLAGATALGGATGLIHSDAENPTEAGRDFAKGAGIAAGSYGAMKMAGKGIENLFSGKTAEDLAVRHLRPTAATSRALGRDRLREIGRETLDSGALQFGNKAEDTAAALSDITNEVGAVKGDIVNASQAKINPKDIADKFDREVIEPLRATAENEGLVAQLEEKRNNFLRKYAPAKPVTEADMKNYAFQGVNENAPPDVKDTGWWTNNLKTAKGYSGKNGKINVADLSDFPEGTFTNAEGVEMSPEEFFKSNVVSNSYPKISNTVDANRFAAETGLAEHMNNQNYQAFSMSPAELEAEKMAVQNNINYKVDPNSKNEAMQGWARTLKEGSESAINDPAFIPSKRAYGNLKSAQLMADRTASLADSGNGLLGHLTDVGVGTEALHEIASGNPAGFAIAGGRALTKGKMSASLATTADKAYKAGQTAKKLLDGNEIVQKLMSNPAGKKFSQVIQAAARRGPGSLAATHFILSQDSDEYNRLMSEEQ